MKPFSHQKRVLFSLRWWQRQRGKAFDDNHQQRERRL